MEPYSKNSESITEKFSREGALLAGAGENLCDGISRAAQDAWNHPERSTKLVTDAAVCGVALAAIARNPAILGKGLQPVFELGIAHGGKLGAGLLATDLSLRMASPVADTWRSANNLEASKQVLGERLGAAVVDYTLMGAGGAAGAAGAKYAPLGFRQVQQLIESTVVRQPAYAFAYGAGSEVAFSELLKPAMFKAIEKPAAESSILMMQGRGYREIKMTGNTIVAEAGQTAVKGEKGDLVLHHLEDGRQIIGAKLLGESGTREIRFLKGFDLKDLFYKLRPTYSSESQRGANVEIIKNGIAGLEGETAVVRNFRHHKVGAGDDCSLYRFKRPMWLDPTEAAPVVKFHLSGKVSRAEPAKPELGDVYLIEKLDARGLAAKESGRGAQSGQFMLFAYDDCFSSQMLNLHALLRKTNLTDPRRLHGFDSKGDMDQKFPTLLQTIQAHTENGRLVIWNPAKKIFEIR